MNTRLLGTVWLFLCSFALPLNASVLFTVGNGGVGRIDTTTNTLVGPLFAGTLVNINDFLAFGSDSNLYVTSNESILRFDPNTGDQIGNLRGSFAPDSAIVSGADGLLYTTTLLSGSLMNGLSSFDPVTGKLVNTWVGSGYQGGAAFGPDGNLYTTTNSGILRLDIANKVSTLLPIPNVPGASFWSRGSVAFGPDNLMYITTGDQHFRRFDVINEIEIGNIWGVVDAEGGLTFGPDGNMYVRNRIGKLDVYDVSGFSPTLLSSEFTPAQLGVSLAFQPVPIPAAVYLFGSGLLGLIGFARQRNNISSESTTSYH